MKQATFFQELFNWFSYINQTGRAVYHVFEAPVNISGKGKPNLKKMRGGKKETREELFSQGTVTLLDLIRTSPLFDLYMERGGVEFNDDEHLFFLYFLAANVFRTDVLLNPTMLILKLFDGDMKKLYLYSKDNPVLINKFIKKARDKRRGPMFIMDKEIFNSILDYDCSNLISFKRKKGPQFLFGPPMEKNPVLEKMTGTADLDDDVILPKKVKDKIKQGILTFKNMDKLKEKWGDTDFFRELQNMVMLFHGEPGTGKTFTANAVSNYLGVPLYTVDIARTQSMWVGGNEKLMMNIFEDFRRKRKGILLFDEADSLFMTRLKTVGRSVDAMHNRVLNILLREIEKTNGIIILTTNLKVNFDEAFERRIRVKVEFGKPSKELRKKIWDNKLIKTDLPIGDDINLSKLSKFDLTGGQIKNVISNALRMTAYRFIQDGNEKVMQDDLIKAVNDEISFKLKEEKTVGFINSEKN